jgi:glutathione synthase/RimK-type ligase-like ATP-grasp enzyme
VKKIIVVNHPEFAEVIHTDIIVTSSHNYLTDPSFATLRNARVFNLEDQYSYQSKGYYVSLMAEARGHKCVPTVKNLQDINAAKLVRSISEECDSLIQQSLKKIRSSRFELSVYFGENLASQHSKLSRELHRIFQVPLMRVFFIQHEDRWLVKQIKTIPFKEIPASHLSTVIHAAQEYFSKQRYAEKKLPKYQYDLAILHNPDEKSPPSNPKALKNFKAAGEKAGFHVEFIQKKDYARIAEFDALLIRETTAVNHHTYEFARKAQADGLAVIDDPDSILKCANKVYLNEILTLNKIPIPHTVVLHRQNLSEVKKRLNFPCVLKIPDSAFSLGVVKVNDANEFLQVTKEMLKKTELLIAQAFTPSAYDWRIGVLNGEAIFACKYFMARGHWQVYNWGANKQNQSGPFETLDLTEVPKAVIQTALKACKLIGNGLYGVDLKMIPAANPQDNDHVYVIEINDNPNIETGVEDLRCGEKLYTRIIDHLKKMIPQA